LIFSWDCSKRHFPQVGSNAKNEKIWANDGASFTHHLRTTPQGTNLNLLGPNLPSWSTQALALLCGVAWDGLGEWGRRAEEEAVGFYLEQRSKYYSFEFNLPG